MSPVNYVARWTTFFKGQTSAITVELVMATDLITHCLASTAENLTDVVMGTGSYWINWPVLCR